MKVAIHQPHYFPWLGYLDKIAKVDKFIIMDDVQLTDRSPMVRNKFLNSLGEEQTLSISVEKKGYREKKTSEIKLFEWTKIRKKHRDFLIYNYQKSVYFEEVWNEISEIFEKDYEFLLELEMDILKKLLNLFNINTGIIYQSDLDYNKENKNNDLILNLCLASQADYYLSGNGARKYMKPETFEKQGVKVVFQKFSYPKYEQINSKEFIPNLSALDILFNCGIEKANKIFWENIKNNNEFSGELENESF